MKTTVVSDNLIMVTRRNLVLPNAYLVREDDGFTLIDTATRGAADKLIAAASLAGGKIRRVALTHGHGDHVGSLDALKERLGEEVEVLIAELDSRIHAGEQVVDGKRASDGGLPATRWRGHTGSESRRITGRTSVVRSEMIVVCQPRTSSSPTATTRRSRRIE